MGASKSLSCTYALIPASSRATMFSTVPYVVSPVTWPGVSFHPKTCPPQQDERGLVRHHLAGRDNRLQDDPCPPAVHHVVRVVTQVYPALRGISVASGSVELAL